MGVVVVEVEGRTGSSDGVDRQGEQEEGMEEGMEVGMEVGMMEEGTEDRVITSTPTRSTLESIAPLHPPPQQ